MLYLDHHVSAQRCRLRDVFLSYEVISMRSVKHMTPCWSPKFSINKSKRCTTAWLNLRTILSMKFFTYKVMSQNRRTWSCLLVCELVHEHDRVEIFVWKHDACHKTYGNYVTTHCTQTRPCMWILAHGHDPVSQTMCKVVSFLQWTRFTVRRIGQTMYSNTVSYVNSCMQGRIRKFKSRVVVFRFRYIGGKLCDKQGVEKCADMSF